MPNLAALRAAIFLLSAKNRWGHICAPPPPAVRGLRKLFTYGIRGRMGVFIQNFLADHHFRVRVGNHLSRSFPQENGVPQGGVLSVALFAVMINDIGQKKNGQKSYLSYAHR